MIGGNASNHGIGYRRKLTSTSMDTASLLVPPDDPVTTTKALLVQIVAPCKFVIPKEAVVDETATSTTSTENGVSDGIPSTLEIVESNDLDEEPESSAVAAPAKTSSASALLEVSEASKEETQQYKAAKKDDEVQGDAAGAPETTDNDQDPTEASEEITAEERATVVKKDDHPEQDTVVNVEELLRITFNNLALEWHLLNIPTYTIVRHLSKAEKEAAVLGEEAVTEEPAAAHPLSFLLPSAKKVQITPHKLDIDDRFEWISINVMVRPASLGIILDRVERIGVGTNCGTLTVLKAELCRTASPYAAMPPAAAAVASVDGNNSVDGGATNPNNKNTNNPDASKSDTAIEKSTQSTDTTTQQQQADAEALAQARAIEAARAEWKNAATRLRVEQVREQIVEQAAFSFDFVALLTVASILAGVGLITNNTVVIVASMLVSPIMVCFVC